MDVLMTCGLLSKAVLAAAVCVGALPPNLALSQEIPSRPGSPFTPPPSAPGEKSPPKGPGGLPTSPLPSAPGRDGEVSAEKLVSVRTATDVAQVGPGQKFLLGFVFDIEPGWHIYWQNAGASGAPTSIQVSGPQGFTIGKTLFPRPLIFEDEMGPSYGFEGQAVVFVEATAPIDLKPGQVMFNAKLNWMVCKQVCLLGRSTQMIPVQTGSGTPPKPGTGIDPVIAKFKKMLPQPISDVAGASTSFDGTTLTISVPAQGRGTAMLFPIERPGVTFGQPSVKVQGEMLTMTVPVTINANDALGQKPTVTGVIGLGQSQTDPCYWFDLTPPAS